MAGWACAHRPLGPVLFIFYVRMTAQVPKAKTFLRKFISPHLCSIVYAAQNSYPSFHTSYTYSRLVIYKKPKVETIKALENFEFITHHSLNQTQPHLLLQVTYRDVPERIYVSIVDDDSFPQHKFSTTVPLTLKLVPAALMLGSSHGLVCLYHSSNKLIVVWNPSIRKSVGIVLPHGSTLFDVYRFGVCRKTSDPKIVKIKRTTADVFALSSRAWKSVSMNMHYRFSKSQVVVDGVIHWVASDFVTKNKRIKEFGEVHLPDMLAASCGSLLLSKINESLVVVSYCYDSATRNVFCEVWMMSTNDVSKSSFTKLFSTVKVKRHYIVGFRNNGLPIMLQMHRGENELEVYEPDSEHLNGLEIYGQFFDMASYTESLLLLNHSDPIIQ